MPKMISDPEDKNPSKGYKPEKLGSGIRVDGKPLKDEAPAKKAAAKDYKPMFDRIKSEAEDKAADTSRTNAMGDTYKKGGMIKSSASRRADGCATKGKTRGKVL